MLVPLHGCCFRVLLPEWCARFAGMLVPLKVLL